MHNSFVITWTISDGPWPEEELDTIRLITRQSMLTEFKSLDFGEKVEMMDGASVYKMQSVSNAGINSSKYASI